MPLPRPRYSCSPQEPVAKWFSAPAPEFTTEAAMILHPCRTITHSGGSFENRLRHPCIGRGEGFLDHRSTPYPCRRHWLRPSPPSRDRPFRAAKDKWRRSSQTAGRNACQIPLGSKPRECDEPRTRLRGIRIVPANPPHASDKSGAQDYEGGKCEHESGGESSIGVSSQLNFLGTEPRRSRSKKSLNTSA